MHPRNKLFISLVEFINCKYKIIQNYIREFEKPAYDMQSRLDTEKQARSVGMFEPIEGEIAQGN
jgi:hypothetical protein